MVEQPVTGAGADELETRFAALEGRVRQLEDQLAVVRLINSWGPAVECAPLGTRNPVAAACAAGCPALAWSHPEELWPAGGAHLPRRDVGVRVAAIGRFGGRR